MRAYAWHERGLGEATVDQSHGRSSTGARFKDGISLQMSEGEEERAGVIISHRWHRTVAVAHFMTCHGSARDVISVTRDDVSRNLNEKKPSHEATYDAIDAFM